MDLVTLLKKAQASPFRLWILNKALAFAIPFNKPHRFRIRKVSETDIEILLPYRRRNLNHIKGLHACGLATLSEFTAGLLLAYRLDPSKYRTVLRTINMQYHYQGKMDALATFSISEAWLREKVLEPLKKEDAVYVLCEVKTYDVKGNHLCTGTTEWQVKNWSKVNLKIKN
jgi:acyl-coenzyme A thioesterase PaaI-like protein